MALKDSLKRPAKMLQVELPETHIDLGPLRSEIQTLNMGLAKLGEEYRHATEAMVEKLAGELRQVRAQVAASKPEPVRFPEAPAPQVSVEAPVVDVSGIETALMQGLEGLSLEVPDRDFEMVINRDSEGRIASVNVKDV